MKRFLALGPLAALLLFTTVSSALGPQESESQGSLQNSRPRFGGRIVVEVVDPGGGPVAGIVVELLQTGQRITTDATGRAVFMTRPGEYDVRVHDLNGPGPPLPNTDFHVVVGAARTVTVKAVDCPLCL